MEDGSERLWERPPSSRFSYAQMSRFPEYDNYNPMAGTDGFISASHVERDIS